MNIKRERRTIGIMIAMYCRHHHSTNGVLCDECLALSSYAQKRLDCCKFGGKKPVCAKCPVHCYKPVMREKIKMVMRYAGPRMLLHHPYLAIMHLVDSRQR